MKWQLPELFVVWVQADVLEDFVQSFYTILMSFFVRDESGSKRLQESHILGQEFIRFQFLGQVYFDCWRCVNLFDFLVYFVCR